MVAAARVDVGSCSLTRSRRRPARIRDSYVRIGETHGRAALARAFALAADDDDDKAIAAFGRGGGRRREEGGRGGGNDSGGASAGVGGGRIVRRTSRWVIVATMQTKSWP
jgi:hypothetical protein